MIEVSRLSGTRSGRPTVKDVSFGAQPGEVTALLDSGGALASEVVRLILGRPRPLAGTVLIDGQPHMSLDHPAAAVGAVLRPTGARLWESPRDHLRRVAAAAGTTRQVADEMLDIVGLTEVADTRVWTLPAGARIRLAVGAAMTPDPANYILDDPFRELREDDARWLRMVLRRLTAQGKAVLLAGGSPMQWGRIVDRVLVVGPAGVTSDVPAREFMARLGVRRVLLRADRQDELGEVLRGMGAGIMTLHTDGGESLAVTGLALEDVCRAAVGFGVLELRESDRSLERVLAELSGVTVPRVGVLAEQGIA